jgi:putative hydrolase of the HAD superfamily
MEHNVTLRFIIFDLDDTLYSRDTGLMREVGHRIHLWLHNHLSLSWEQASVVRRQYYERYGTTLGGLVALHDVDTNDYLAFVHDIPVEEYLEPTPALSAMLASIPLRKAIYTNATSEYSWRVMNALGVAGHFDRVVGIEQVGMRNKWSQDAYERALALLGAQGPECLMVEDTVRNLRAAKDLGLATVLVNAEPTDYVDYVVRDVLEVGQVVNGLLRSGGAAVSGSSQAGLA